MSAKHHLDKLQFLISLQLLLGAARYYLQLSATGASNDASNGRAQFGMPPTHPETLAAVPFTASNSWLCPSAKFDVVGG